MKQIQQLPIEIKDEITVGNRVYVELYDDLDYNIAPEGYAWLMTEDGKDPYNRG